MAKVKVDDVDFVPKMKRPILIGLLGLLSLVVLVTLTVTLFWAIGVPLAKVEIAFVAAVIVAAILALDLAVLWTLKRIGGPLQANVKATISRFGGNLLITSAGLLGAFLAIACLALGAIFLLIRVLMR